MTASDWVFQTLGFDLKICGDNVYLSKEIKGDYGDQLLYTGIIRLLISQTPSPSLCIFRAALEIWGVGRIPIYTHPATNSDEEAKAHETSGEEARHAKWDILGLLIACFASGALGYVFARLLDRQKAFTSPAGPQFTKELRTFSYNRDFSYPPSNATDGSWNGLFPGKGSGGFFNHPHVEGGRATLSVLHQLHCLDGIRHIYYVNNDAATTGKLLVEEELEPQMRRSHMRHCIDLLRQSLMCCGDSSIERVDPELKGVTGWETEHICTSWEELQEWVKGRLRLDTESRVVEIENSHL